MISDISERHAKHNATMNRATCGHLLSRKDNRNKRITKKKAAG